MELYESFKNGKINPSDGDSFKELIRHLFNTTGCRKDLYKASSLPFPKFFQIFLETPSKYEEFMEVITGPSIHQRGAIHNNANILTLISCATFHLSTLYIIQNIDNENIRQDAARYFHLPLSKWLQSILYPQEADKIDLNQKIKGYFTPFQYLLIMSYISKYLQLHDRPLFAFMNTIENEYTAGNAGDRTEYIHLNLFDDILLFLIDIDDNKNKDIYSHNIKYIVDDIVDYVHFNASRNINVFKNGVYNIEHYFENNGGQTPDSYLGDDYSDKLLEYWNTYTEQTRYQNGRTIFIFFYVVNTFMIFVMLDLNWEIEKYVINQKWNDMMKMLYDSYYNSKHIEDDILLTERIYDLNIDLEHLYFVDNWLDRYRQTKKRCILSSIITKHHVQKNANFIRKFIKSLIEKQYTYIPFYTYREHEYHQFLVLLDYEQNNAISLLLNAIYTIDDNEMLDYSLEYRRSFVDSLQSIPIPNYTLSFSQTNPDEQNLGLYFKDIIKNLLRLSENVSLMAYIRKLFKYNDKLLKIGINLLDYKIMKYLPSSISNTLLTRSSVNMPKIYNNSKANKINVLKKKDGNDFVDINFVDEVLMKKLQKINALTVEGLAKGEYDKPNRIIKIRHFLQNKYSGNLTMANEIRLQVTKGTEFDTLFNHWIGPANKRSLNTRYFIRYINTPGIDAGGLTKQFFTQIGKQMKERYFKVAYSGSSRYVLNSRNIPSSDIAEFIGHVLALFIVKGIYIDFSLSIMYLAYLMFQPTTFSNEEKFLYYILDIDKSSRYDNYLRHCENNYEYDENDENLEYNENYLMDMACNPEYVVNEYLPTVYNHNPEHMESFCKGFFIKKKYFHSKFVNINSKIRIYDMDKLISMPKLSKKYLKSVIFDNIHITSSTHGRITEDHADAKVYTYFRDLMIKDKKTEYARLYNQYDKSLITDASEQERYDALESPQVFRKSVLMFWSGTEGISEQRYSIAILSRIGDAVKGHTCSNTLDIPIPERIESKERLFNVLMTLFIKDYQNTYDDA
jgi:hypothetical protein